MQLCTQLFEAKIQRYENRCLAQHYLNAYSKGALESPAAAADAAAALAVPEAEAALAAAAAADAA